MLSLWAKNIETTKYDFIKYIDYDNRFYEVDQLDTNIYSEAMVIVDNNECIFYVELQRPYVRRK